MRVFPRGARRWRRAGALCTGLTLVGVLLPAVPAVAGPGDVHRPLFIVKCRLSHRLPDDPIGHPGQPGGSHMHDFYGSTATRADSTVEELQAAPTTCDRPGDTAAYWTPTVYRDGRQVGVAVQTIYYRNTARKPADLRAFPLGFKMIAGNPHATAPQKLKIVEWACRIPDDGHKGAWSARPPVCTDGYHLIMKVWFPDCWNGVDADSADHQSHVAYSDPKGVCPASHPVPIPEIAITASLRVPTVPGPPGPGGTAGYYDDAITLSSGDVYTLHADFWNTWDMGELQHLVDFCLVQNHACFDPGFS